MQENESASDTPAANPKSSKKVAKKKKRTDAHVVVSKSDPSNTFFLSILLDLVICQISECKDGVGHDFGVTKKLDFQQQHDQSIQSIIALLVDRAVPCTSVFISLAS
jgi:hypothetical protein